LQNLIDRFRSGLSKTRSILVDGITAAVSGTAIDENVLEEIEGILIQADLGVGMATDIVKNLRKQLSSESQAGDVFAALRKQLLSMVAVDTHYTSVSSSPHVILVVGVNGAGKTTTVGKLAAKHAAAGRSVLLAACDTFRAAAVPQLEIWAERSGAEMIRSQQGADPAAVAFDAAAAAKSRAVDVLIVDTAGRLHTKVNLMEELKKVKRSLARQLSGAPNETLLVLDATTGQNALVQGRQFHDSIAVDGLVLTKLDGTAKGGIVFSLSCELGLPIRMIGVGEQVEDLQPFDTATFVDAMLPPVSD
tara:strand:+ start:449 stop:1363 length:915 start_codon:yes stop_codon:yes gene_type:complete